MTHKHGVGRGATRMLTWLGVCMWAAGLAMAQPAGSAGFDPPAVVDETPGGLAPPVDGRVSGERPLGASNLPAADPLALQEELRLAFTERQYARVLELSEQLEAMSMESRRSRFYQTAARLRLAEQRQAQAPGGRRVPFISRWTAQATTETEAEEGVAPGPAERDLARGPEATPEAPFEVEPDTRPVSPEPAEQPADTPEAAGPVAPGLATPQTTPEAAPQATPEEREVAMLTPVPEPPGDRPVTPLRAPAEGPELFEIVGYSIIGVALLVLAMILLPRLGRRPAVAGGESSSGRGDFVVKSAPEATPRAPDAYAANTESVGGTAVAEAPLEEPSAFELDLDETPRPEAKPPAAAGDEDEDVFTPRTAGSRGGELELDDSTETAGAETDEGEQEEPTAAGLTAPPTGLSDQPAGEVSWSNLFAVDDRGDEVDEDTMTAPPEADSIFGLTEEPEQPETTDITARHMAPPPPTETTAGHMLPGFADEGGDDGEDRREDTGSSIDLDAFFGAPREAGEAESVAPTDAPETEGPTWSKSPRAEQAEPDAEDDQAHLPVLDLDSISPPEYARTDDEPADRGESTQASSAVEPGAEQTQPPLEDDTLKSRHEEREGTGGAVTRPSFFGESDREADATEFQPGEETQRTAMSDSGRAGEPGDSTPIREFRPDDLVAINLGSGPGAPPSGTTHVRETRSTEDSGGEDLFEREYRQGMEAFGQENWGSAVHHLSIAAALRPQEQRVREQLREARNRRDEAYRKS